MTVDHNDKIGFIGGGNMARAIVTGLIDSGYAANNLLIAEPDAHQRDVLQATLPDCVVDADNHAIANAADILVLAVKPQALPTVCRDLASTVARSRPLLISIAAGVRSDDIDAWLGGGHSVVRVMPNQPALLRQGVSGYYANPHTSSVDRSRAVAVLQAIGRVVQVDSERDLDAVTALSGSGPAYVYLLIDMLVTAGVAMGLSKEAAGTLAVETVKGAASIAATSDDSTQQLIGRVRSPGGTTAAALDSLERDDIRAIFTRALEMARERAATLADEAHLK